LFPVISPYVCLSRYLVVISLPLLQFANLWWCGGVSVIICKLSIGIVDYALYILQRTTLWMIRAFLRLRTFLYSSLYHAFLDFLLHRELEVEWSFNASHFTETKTSCMVITLLIKLLLHWAISCFVYGGSNFIFHWNNDLIT
jgi:hypothetical protein